MDLKPGLHKCILAGKRRARKSIRSLNHAETSGLPSYKSGAKFWGSLAHLAPGDQMIEKHVLLNKRKGKEKNLSFYCFGALKYWL